MTASPLTRGRTLDHAAQVYDVLSPLMLFGQEERMSRTCLQFLVDPAIRTVLDVGCGTGTLTLEAARLVSGRAGSRVTGIDAAPKMIGVARRKVKGLANIVFDVVAAEALPYPDRHFDHAMSTFFFHHIDYELKVRALNEIFRTLTPGGLCVIIDVDVPTNTFGRLCAWAGYFLFQQDEIKENIEGKLRQAMRESAFGSFELVGRYQGYISVFKLRKDGGRI